MRWIKLTSKILATLIRAFEIISKWGGVAYQYLPVNDWSVYAHAPGQATKINACKGGFWFSSASYDGFPTALGAFHGGVPSQYSGCIYQGPKTAAGSVSCLDMSTWAACSAAPKSTQQCYNGQGFDQFTAQVECIFWFLCGGGAWRTLSLGRRNHSCTDFDTFMILWDTYIPP